MIRYETCSAQDLTAEQIREWSDMLIGPAPLDSAFFRPEFTRAVASVRDDVEVAVMRAGETTVGFFPFQRNGRHIQPIVGRLSEFHGAITAPHAEWSATDLQRACGIRSWHFDHLPLMQTEFARHAWGHKPSPYLDLSDGYSAARESLRKSGSTWTQTERKARKLEREVGPLRFEWQANDSRVFAALVDWKSHQHRRTGVLEIFKRPWVTNLLESLRQTQTPDFSAPLSALYAGDKVVAVHLGLCSSRALHIWFPTYDTQYEAYSPGLILLIRLAEAAAERGVTRIDFGPGEERYKQNFSTGEFPLAEGLVTASPLEARLRRAWFQTKRLIRESPYRKQLEQPLLLTRRLRQWLSFR